MRTGERLFFFILAFRFLVANPLPLDFAFIPVIDCNDLNRNGQSDFISLDDTVLPRTLYHIELSTLGIKTLWKYTMPKHKKGYFVDMILGDYDNNGAAELIVVAYQDESNDIFYIFPIDVMGLYSNTPTITHLNTTGTIINNPRRLYPMSQSAKNQNYFILSQGSPNRRLIICEYINNKINFVDSIGEKFLKNTMAPIDVAFGNFNEDELEDIFILDNGLKPSGQFIFGDGSIKDIDLSNFPRLHLLNDRGIDLDFDGIDDLVIITKSGELMSNRWGTESISLSEREINGFMLNRNDDLIYLIGISQSGKIGEYNIDPLSKKIISSNYILPSFKVNNYTNIHTLFTADKILLVHDGTNPELLYLPIADELKNDIHPSILNQRIYSRSPDYIINTNNLFSHSIENDSLSSFLSFSGKYLPSGMDFNINNINLEWTPNVSQLGFHEFSYILGLRAKGSLEINIDNGKRIISQNESIIEKYFSYLIYVNDPVKFGTQEDKLNIVNGEKFEWIIPIDDKNVDAWLSVNLISNVEGGIFKLIQPDTLISIDTIEISKSISVDTTNILDTLIKQIDEPEEFVPFVEPEYIDTVNTEFEDFVEEKIETEQDPIKIRKLESSAEEFKEQEEVYRDKLKTHIKILRDGKNIWIPKDSLNVETDSIQVMTPELIMTDSINIVIDTTQIASPELIMNDSISRSLEIIEKTIIDTLIIKETQIDTNFQEISYNTITQHKAQFSWFPPEEIGDYNFTLTTHDGYSFDTLDIILTVHPKIDLSMNKTNFVASVNHTFTTSILVSQIPPSNDYSYALIDAPENMRVNENGMINWIPLATQVDDYSFTLHVTDSIAKSILPYNIYVNAPPVISSRPPELLILNKGEKFFFQLESFDLNKNAQLQWRLLNGPQDINLNDQGVLKWTGNKLDHHAYAIELNDGIDSTRWEGVIYVNASPTIISKPKTVVSTNEIYEYSLSASDANSMSPLDSSAINQIEFALIKGPKEMVIDNNILSWKTNNNTTGQYPIIIIASDGVEETMQEFELIVNSFPVITSVDSITIEIGDTLNFQILAKDKNSNDTLSYYMDALRSGMDLNNNTGVLIWPPDTVDIGLHDFIIQVRDGHGKSGTSVNFQIYVYQPPRLTSDLLSEAFAGLEYAAFLTAEDMYDEKLNNSNAIKIESATFKYYNLSEYANHFKWTPREVDIGKHELVIKLTDNYGFTTLHTQNISVFSNPCLRCDSQPELIPADTTQN